MSKLTIIRPEAPPAPPLPEVGDFWSHASDLSTVYVRIPDGQGSLALSGSSPEHAFFSVRLLDGFLCHTQRKSRDLIVFQEPQLILA
jgi:hypothetical protein